MISSRLIKILLILTGVLALVVLVHTLLQRSHSQTPFGRDIENVQKITLQMGPEKIVLQKDGSDWFVAASTGPERYRADSTVKIPAMISQLKNLQLEDVISDRPDRAADYGVEPAHGLLVSLFRGNGSLIAEGVFGKQAQDFTHIYFKFNDQPSVYLGRGAIRGEIGEANVTWWRDRSLLNIPEDQVEAIFIDGPGFKTPLARSSDTWSSNGIVVDATPVWGLVGVMAHLKLDDFINPAEHPELAVDKLHYATITLQIKGGIVHEIHFGRKDGPSKRYPVAVDKDPTLGWVSEATANSLLRKPSEFHRKP
jgi:hypothetical protein